MILLPLRLARHLAGLALFVSLLGGCGLLNAPSQSPTARYALDSGPPALNPAKHSGNPAISPLTLIVSPPHAAAGFDSNHLIYRREPHRLEHFAHSEWIDVPARMVAPLIVSALEQSGSFRAVVLTPSAATAELRLDTEIVRLQHEFGPLPSQVRFTLRAYLLDNTTRQVIAWREFDERIVAESDTPAGGVLAANLAVNRAIQALATFCAEATAQRMGKP